MENNNVRAASIRLSTVATSTRQTAKTDFGTVMRNGLIRAGNVAVEGMRVAAPFVPGSAIVSAALAGANSAQAMAGPSYVRSGGGGGGYGTSASGLVGPSGPAGGGTAAPGTYGGGSLAIPGRRPGLGTDLGTPTSSFANGAFGNTGAGGAGGTGGVGSGGDTFGDMMSATRQMSEFQASFNLQYLQLQEKIQIDTRQFNLISNIMKTKHDAAKNALNNVR